jgi:hypothetical protein
MSSNGMGTRVRARSIELLNRLEPVAPADRGDDQVQRRVSGVPAFFDEVFRRLFQGSNLHELLDPLVVFAKVDAKSAIADVNVGHDLLLS